MIDLKKRGGETKMDRSVLVKSVHVRFSEGVHRTAKVTAAAMGKTLSEYLAQLVLHDQKPRDIVAEALAMPVGEDDEGLSPETLRTIQKALKEPNNGTWETLQTEAAGKRKKQHASKD